MTKPEIPVLPPAVPRRGNALTRAVGRGMLRLFGWRIAGRFPDRGKFVIVVAPHTSNWDTVVGLAAMLALGLDAHWLGKHTLFKGPAGRLLRFVGGVPVDRRTPHGTIGRLAEIIASCDQFVIGLAPEGTRHRVERWKTGFYRIAEAAQVPMVPIYFDYARRVAGIGSEIAASGDMEGDFERIRDFFRNVKPRVPERFNADIRP